MTTSIIETNLLDQIFSEIEEAGVNFSRMNQSDLETTMRVCNRQDAIMWIHDYTKLTPHFINDIGKEYYGFGSNMFVDIGFEVYGQIAHPDDIVAVQKLIAFFNENPKGTCRTVCRVKHNSGEYRWFYALDRALSFTAAGTPQYMTSISYDVESLIQSNSKNHINQAGIVDKRTLYMTLTAREKEILKLVADDMTSHEIANELFIETSTVDTHRKHIIKKLHVKSSIGLVKYSLLFSD